MTNMTKPVVSIQGKAGAFHHIAAVSFFSEEIEILGRNTFSEVHQDLQSEADFGLVAIENSLIGVITASADVLPSDSLRIIGEVTLHIHHQLWGVPGATLSNISEVHSQQPALDQCTKELSALSEVKQVATEDTAKSVLDMMADGDQTRASIASSLAGKLYKAEKLKANIEDQKENYTRFYVLGKPQPTDRQQQLEKALLGQVQDQKNVKSTIRLSVNSATPADEVAALLASIPEATITSILSRPNKSQPWAYTTLIDLVHPVSADIKQLISSNQEADVLGTYPIGETYES